MWIVNNRKIFYSISIALVVISILALSVWKLVPSIDFTGGTLIDVSYSSGNPDQSAVAKALSTVDPAVSVRPSGTGGFIVRMKAVDQNEKAAVVSALSLNSTASSTIASFDSVGPVLGLEAVKRSIVSVLLVILGIIIYITWAFRKVSQPVSSWKYGLVAVVSLVHDVIIPMGAFSILGHLFGYEVDTLFVTAVLVILGFSVHNTIVVFDRVRENLRTSSGKKPFLEIVGESISQTFTRSMNTSATVVLALVVLYILGGSATAHFTLALIIGIVAGTFSSVFIGSPLLVTIERWQGKR
ncbi:MAG: protein translocase subunit SecF [Minisyncoccia bacterium]|jgi:preprotein translocase subunit SecF